MILWKLLFLLSLFQIVQGFNVTECSLYLSKVVKVQSPSNEISIWDFYEPIEMKPNEVGKLIFFKFEQFSRLSIINVNSTTLKVAVDSYYSHDTVHFIAQEFCSNDIQFLNFTINSENEGIIFLYDIKYIIPCQPIIHSTHPQLNPVFWYHGAVCTNNHTKDFNSEICVPILSENQQSGWKYPSGSYEILFCAVDNWNRNIESIFSSNEYAHLLNYTEQVGNVSLIRLDIETLKPGTTNGMSSLRMKDGTIIVTNVTQVVYPGFYDLYNSMGNSQLYKTLVVPLVPHLFTIVMFYPEKQRMHAYIYQNEQNILHRKRGENCELGLVITGNNHSPTWIEVKSFQTGGHYEGYSGQINNSFMRIPFNTIQKQLDYEQLQVIVGGHHYGIHVIAVDDFPVADAPIDEILVTENPIYGTTPSSHKSFFHE